MGRLRLNGNEALGHHGAMSWELWQRVCLLAGNGGDQRSGSVAVHITGVENDKLSSAQSQGLGEEQLGEFLLQRLFPLHSGLRPQ